VVGLWLSAWLVLPILMGPTYHTILSFALAAGCFNELI